MLKRVILNQIKKIIMSPRFRRILNIQLSDFSVRLCSARSTFNFFSSLIHNEIIVDQVTDQIISQKLFVRFFWELQYLFLEKISNLFKTYFRLIFRKKKTFLQLRYSQICYGTYNIEKGLNKINVVESSSLLSWLRADWPTNHT
jgi:hypothetical protein